MIRDEIKRQLAQAVERAMDAGDLPRIPVPDIVLDHPPNPSHGDYATPIAMKMARAAGRPPLEIAGAITAHFRHDEAVAAIETAKPGFVNLHLASAWLQQQLDEIIDAGDRFGSQDLGNGRRVQIEFVSANPTGPLHVGAGRNAALGDTLANLMGFCGYHVEREYYVNNAGSRIEALAGSVFSRYCQQLGIDEPMPDDGYPAEYVSDLARELVSRHGESFLALSRQEALREIGRLAVDLVIEWIGNDLGAMNVRFDRWYFEQELFESGLFERTMNLLREKGHVAERDGAIWFTSTDLGDEKDNVLIRSNGQPTYFAADIAYHFDKFLLRGFDRVINVWAADHQGHVPRMKSMARALDIDPERLIIVLYQLVRLVKDGKPVRMGKRTGTYVTVRDALDEISADALRFFLVARSADAAMDLDLDLAMKQANENPVFYVQMAHARCAGILRNAPDVDWRSGSAQLLQQPTELALIRKMLILPELIETAVEELAPHHLPFYSQELARTLHLFYDDCRVISEDAALTAARLKLVTACKQVLANSLTLIGVEAPERM